MPLGLAGTLLTSQFRASAGKAGVLGIAGTLAFNVLLKRSPMGAMVLGGAFLAHQAYKAGQAAKARKDAKRAMEEGVSHPPAPTAIAA